MPPEAMTPVAAVVIAYAVFMVSLAWAWLRAHEPMPITGPFE